MSSEARQLEQQLITSVSLDELLAELRAIGDPNRRPEAVDALLASACVDEQTLGRHLHFASRRYTRNLVYRDERFELLVLCWDRGVRSPVHGHAGQQCWFIPVAGAFDLEDYRILDGGREPGPARLERTLVRRGVGPGALDRRSPDADVHGIAVARGTRRAVSLNLYARPIDACLVYDLAAGTCALRRLRYDSYGGVM